MYIFPEGLYADIRIETTDNAFYQVQNDEVKQNSETSVTGAMIRVYDGRMWYTSVTNDLDSIQAELDSLAAIACKNDDIDNDPMVRLFEVHKDKVLRFEDDKDIRKVTRQMREELVKGYTDACIDKNDENLRQWYGAVWQTHFVKRFYSSTGAEIEQDYQTCGLSIWYDFVIDGIKTDGGRIFQGFYFDDLMGHESEVRDKRDKVIDYAKNAVDVTPGEYVCVLHPSVTSMFTHESFGHKSEADYMLSDKTLQDEWVLGKKVGNDLVSIYDSGDMLHRGYIAYDDEGSKPKETFLIKNGDEESPCGCRARKRRADRQAARCKLGSYPG